MLCHIKHLVLCKLMSHAESGLASFFSAQRITLWYDFIRRNEKFVFYSTASPSCGHPTPSILICRLTCTISEILYENSTHSERVYLGRDMLPQRLNAAFPCNYTYKIDAVDVVRTSCLRKKWLAPMEWKVHKEPRIRSRVDLQGCYLGLRLRRCFAR